MNAAAVILCAGKGTRMNDDTKNKVCFDCAGVPVIRRIIDNMRRGGVTRFAIVVGYNAQSVMDVLDGEEGVIYAYQKEQKGTGHAALCGLKALSSVGCEGSVIVSMGDKIVASGVIAGLLQRTERVKAVWGVQPLDVNPNGGRVIAVDGKPYGVVEFADAALMALASVPKDSRREKLISLGLNEKKAEKVLKKAENAVLCGTKQLCGRSFTADEILSAEYANAGLYCFDTQSAIEAIKMCDASNAQGEIYLTDTLEYFASRDEAVLFPVKSSEDMLTYSTKPELREMSLHFIRNVSQLICDIESGKEDSYFNSTYRPETSKIEKTRYISLLKHFMAVYGDKKAVITRSPGRINLMGRHIDHRGGGINVMTTDNDTVIVASPREDDTVNISNIDKSYPSGSFSVSEQLGMAAHDNWLDYLAAENVRNQLAQSRGDWSNYVKSAVLRFQLSSEMALCGMDIAASGSVPIAAGLSSSSSIVVATAEAIVALNSLNITDRSFIDMCGEGEWFVGSRGGAGDHAAMKCSRRGYITHLGFKPFTVGGKVRFSDKYAIVVADSKTQAKKSEGSKDKFNAKVASYEFALMLLNRSFPDRNLREFRDIAHITPESDILRMLLTLPQAMTRDEIIKRLPEHSERIVRIFANHYDPGVYDIRGVALYGVAECIRAEKCMDAIAKADYYLLGQMMKISHDGDRVCQADVSDEAIQSILDKGTELYMVAGAYGCSTERIDFLCDLLNGTDGVLGSEIVGAGLGGCVIALIEKDKAENVIKTLNKEYYDRFNCEHGARVYMPSSGSSVLF